MHDQLSQLSPERRKLLEKILQAKGVTLAQNTAIPRRAADSAPLSFAQQRLWFLDQFEPNSPQYNIPLAVRLEGALDMSLLERAFSEVVRRHEALRTRFIQVDGQPMQVIGPPAALALPLVDLRHLPGQAREAEALRRAREDALRPFDLRAGPLLRATLLRLSEGEHMAILTMHHIISDGWSMGVLVRELGSIYGSLATDRPSPLPALPIQYADYAAWQRERLDGTALEQQLTYWREQLVPLAAPLELPGDRPRPAVQSGRGATYTFRLPRALTERLTELSRRENATLFMTLLAGFQVLLHRYSGQDDIRIGSPIANRTRAELEPLIGCFVNTLVFRADLAGDPPFRALLAQVRETALGAYANQDLPFELLVERLQPQRDMSHTPLFQAMFVLQNLPSQTQPIAGLTMRQVQVPGETAPFDLTLTMVEGPEGLEAELEYTTDLFDEATIARLAGHLGTLLAAASVEPDMPIGTLPLLTPTERDQILSQWNRTAQVYPTAGGIHELVTAQASRTPAAPALAQAGNSDGALSYAELDAQTTRLAHHLRQLGVGPERLVALSLPRSPELIVALLATLKAGGAYLPLDPAYPAARLRLMLEDARPGVLLTSSALADAAWLPEGRDRPQVVVVEELAAAEPHGEYAPEPLGVTDPQQLAYVIYTSGSTGTPKGVLVPHRAVVNLSCGVVERFGLAAADRVLQFATISFDAAVEEIFGTLTSGGALLLRPGDLPPTPAELLRLVADEQITVLDISTAYWHTLVDELTRSGATLPPSLRLVVVGGEAASSQALAAWRKLAGPGVRWLNTYGPTETTVTATLYDPDEDVDQSTGSSALIGRPLPNYTAFLLDRHMEPVPVGVAGELYIGGAGVARGYLNRPELTAERFVELYGQRLYRTGDLARYRPGGSIEFLGRVDNQVKIRGFRVEPGEIEAALTRHPAVDEAIVIARTDAAGQNALVAYVLTAHPAEHRAALAAELRALLKARLPEFMVPAAIVALARWPLTPAGKIDRRALPNAEPAAIPSAVPLRTPTEELLAALWQQLLNVGQLGGDADFFALGGHSLLATQLVARAQDTLGVELPVRAIFEAPTLSALAARVDQARQQAAGFRPPPIVQTPRHDALPLSFAQQRVWFLDQLEPGSPQNNIPDAVRMHGTLDVAVAQRCLNEIVRRHEVLRTSFPTVDGTPRQLIASELTLGLPVIDLRHLSEAEREGEARRLAGEEARRPFDLGRGPLLRATLLRLADEEHLALFTMHHSVSDGWSSGVLIGELATLYQAFVAGRPSPLPELQVQYADYAAWQRGWLQHADERGESPLQRQLTYWRSELDDIPALLALPTDRPRPAVQSVLGATHSFRLGRELADGLAELGRREGATLFMTLLAGFQTLLHRYSGQDDICVGTPVANRTRAELEPLIGCFINTLVLRGNLAGNPSFRTLLGRVRETALGAYAHQDVPFEMVVDALQPERDLSHTPLFQVMLLLQNTPSPEIRLPGLTLAAMETESGISNFDLTLAIAEDEQGLNCAFEYSSDLFDRTTVERLAERFAALLEAVVAAPDTRVGAVPLLGPQEAQRLAAWNSTARPFTQRGIHELIAAQAARTPAAPALAQAGNSGGALSYAELDAQATRLAHHLRQLGVGPERLVALSLLRSPALIVALLAILKAGGAYLPLDPAYPAARLRLMLEDARPGVLLTSSALADAVWLPEGPDRPQVVVVEELAAAEPDEEQTREPLGVTDPQQLAYVIYTSGSTGTPKGVLVPHRAVVNHNQAAIELFGLTAADRVLQFATISFDAAVEEIFPTLMAGATLVLRPEGALPSVAELLAMVAEHQITVLDLPTAYWHAWASEQATGALSIPPSLRLVVVGGEAASSTALAAWRAGGAGHLTWLNTYGPTEATVIATAYALGPGEAAPPAGAPIPIGRPIANTTIAILDRYAEPAPVGVAGELHIGGAGVARGYLNRPELTAERFVEVRGERLYRTGDLARYLPDGTIEYLGRTDSQVKLRGFRVEPGEIEAVLQQHQGVGEAVVVVREDAPGARRLVAYVTPAGGAAEDESDAAALRAFVSERLPDYMVPSAVVPLAALPLTPSGKLDRRALPAPHDLAAAPAAERPPIGVSEAALAQIWAEVLGRPHVGVHDNFFELGGDSILTIQVIARANAVGLRLSPRQLFEHPTVARLAAVAGTAGAAIAEHGVLEGPAPLTPIQRWFFAQELPAPHHWNQALLLAVRQPLQRPLLERALLKLLEHHDALRLRFTNDGQGWRQAYAAPDGHVPLAWLDLAGLNDAEQQAAITARATTLQASLNLQTGPLVRAAYFGLGADRPGRLLLVIHHLAVDGVSWRIVLGDLQVVYDQLAADAPPALPAKTTSFRQWAERLQAYAGSEAARQELAYWRTVAGSIGRLPVDTPGGENREDLARSLTIALSAEETRALLTEVPPVYHTEINDVLLTALAQAVLPVAGGDALLVELEGHGREDLFDDVDLSRTVGWFTTTFPVRLSLTGAHGPGEALKAVKEQLRAVPKRGIGYGVLRYLGPDDELVAQLADLPKAEISFNYLGQVGQDIPADAPFGLVSESTGPDRDGRGARGHLLEIDGSISGGQLRMEWTFSAGLHRPATVEAMAEAFLAALRRLIAHCRAPEAGGYTPSDFGLAKLDQQKLDKVLAKLGKAKGKTKP